MTVQKPLFLKSHLDSVKRIYYASFDENIRVDLDAAKLIVADRINITNGMEHFMIIDISNVREITFEAREFLQHPEAGLNNIKAVAIIVNNPVAALIANFFMKAGKDFPTKVFSNMKDASAWIKILNR